VQVTASFVKVARQQSALVHSISLPMIFESVQPAVESEYLISECVTLWLYIMRNLPVSDTNGNTSYTASLDELFATK
jgi:hypothetical protein